MDNNYDESIIGRGIWEHFTMQDGLPDMKIECLFEDSRGILWIGTHDRGVVCYEGDEFRSYSRKDGLVGNSVFSILEDREGDLWFGTNRGLCRFDGNVFEEIDLGESYGFLWGSCIDSKGQLWFGLGGRAGYPPTLCRWDGRQAGFVFVSEAKEATGGSIHKIICDKRGEIWAGGENLYRQINGTSFERIIHPASDFYGIQDFLLWDDETVVIAAEKGIWSYKEGEWKKFYSTDWYSPISLLRTVSGICWMMTYDGKLMRYDGNEFKQMHHLDAIVRGGLCQDQAGRLWVGTYGMGLYVYDITRMKIFGTQQGLPVNLVECIVEDEEGRLWIGTKNGLVSYDDNQFSSVCEEERLFQNSITNLLVDHRNWLWIGTGNGLMFVNEKGKTKFCVWIDELKGYRIDHLIEDKNGKIWFGSPYGRGFGYWDNGKIAFFHPGDTAKKPSWIGALIIDSKGNMWLGSANPTDWDGLCLYNGDSFKKVNTISGSSILTLYETKDGNIWIGTNEGLNCFNGEQTRGFSQEDGLSCDIVTAITQGRDGTLWIGTEGGGVCCYDGRVFQVIQVPGDPGCNVIHAIHQDSSGQFWFCTEGGLIQYRPKKIKPEIEITEVIADNPYPATGTIQFPTSVGRVSFCFSGRSKQEHSSYLVYRYCLQGFEDEWRQTRARQVEYPQLRPGEYIFSVEAIDRDLNYSQTAEIKLSVTKDLHIEALTEALRSETIKGEFIGESDALKKVKRQIQEVAWTDLTVLVQGETGTGKGLAARGIHELSGRKSGPFIHVNCGGLPKDLVESNLFGHERGAFTGAIALKLGKFELADGGTIFLDEIGDLPLDSQTRLLHVLQEHLIERVGGDSPIHVDVRVIAATNRDLVREVREGNFRADLYYRLNVFPIIIPPLRERKEDIPLLSRYFVLQFATHLHRQPPFFSQEAMEKLMEYDWPGNVRELEHTLQRAVILASEDGVERDHIILGPVTPTEKTSEEEFQVLPLEEYERRYLEKVLEYTGGVIHGKRGAALLLGMKPTTLRSRLEKLGLKLSKKRWGD